jgi:flagellar protein FliO/FliZ
MMRRLIPALFLSLFALTAWAQQATPANPVQIVPPGSAVPTFSVFQTLFSLLLVLAILGGLAWFLKKFGPRHQSGGAGLKVVGHLNIGGRERVMVIEVGDQWIVVGAAPGRVNALATMPKGEGAAMLSPHEPSSPNFADWLKKTIDRRNGKQE